MKRSAILFLTFLLVCLLCVTGIFVEYKSAFVSLFASRILYSLQDYSRVKNLEDSILSRKENEFPPKITDQNALFYLYSLKGDAQYRSSDLSGAVLSYSEALRILEDERVENNRKFILEKLKKPEPPKPEPKKVEPPKPEPPKSEPPKETKSATGSKSETESNGKSGQNEVKWGSWSTTNSWATAGVFQQKKQFSDPDNTNSQNVERSRELLRTMDNEKQKYLRSGSGSDDTESLMNGFSNYFSGDMKKFLDTQDTEESQDW